MLIVCLPKKHDNNTRHSSSNISRLELGLELELRPELKLVADLCVLQHLNWHLCQAAVRVSNIFY